MGTRMKTTLSLLALALVFSGSVHAGPTKIAQLPLLNIEGTGSVQPNLMLLYDNSGSMARSFTPDYIDDVSTCRAQALMSGGTRRCVVGEPPYMSPEFNKQYYNPKITYKPPVDSKGVSYDSKTAAKTTNWTAVPTDGFGVNKTDLAGTTSATTTDLVTKFPDLEWCGADGSCVRNRVTYTYPDDYYKSPKTVSSNPYYYTILAAEYCTDASLTTCKPTAVGAAAPDGYEFPANVRWCDSAALTNCQAKYVGNFIYPRFSNPNGGAVGAFGTITIGASYNNTALSINSVSIADPAGAQTITNNAVSAPNGTNSATEQQDLATALAASIIAKTGLARQYTACVRTPSASPAGVPSCASLGIPVGGANVVAVIPIDCIAGTTGKPIGACSLVTDNAREGWAFSVSTTSAGTGPRPTAILAVSGTTENGGTPKLASLALGGTTLFTGLGLLKDNSATAVAKLIYQAVNKGTTKSTVTAYLGGNNVSPTCKAQPVTSVCLVSSSSAMDGAALSVGTVSNQGSLLLAPTGATVIPDTIPYQTLALGSGNKVFVRTDIVKLKPDGTAASYPRDSNRNDCVVSATACTYDEEMTNFANWYSYYKTRNQMMKTAVGQAFQPVNEKYRVGLASLSEAGSEGQNITKPHEFSGAHRDAWYATLYGMTVSGGTPLRKALHAIGKMYANVAPYKAATVAEEVVQFPCQQNFTFVTTDGYWNGAQAAGVTNNDKAENAARFCLRGKGCVDPNGADDKNTLSDVALYWYNGGSNDSVSSLRTEKENWNKPGLVPAADGENTRLHMNTYTLGLGVDGVMTYEPNYDTSPSSGSDFHKLITGVTTGCPWNNNGAYIWPDTTLSDTTETSAYQERVDDLWHAAINGHGKYFSAADPKQVIAGLQSALNNIKIRVGAAAAAATSTPNISQEDNDIFSDTFTTVKWYGELSDKKIDTVTGIVSSTAKWNSSDVLGKKVAAAADTRKLLMLDTGKKVLKNFLYSDENMTELERSWFNKKCAALFQCPFLSAADLAIADSGENMVNWLRGQQQYANDVVFRSYSKTKLAPAGASAPIPIVLGDIVSSKPAFLREPRKGYTLAGYSEYKVEKTTTNPRVATVFAAANDGMLHAFRAETGEEMWAYLPRITMGKLHKQASTNYGTNHQFSTDGSPEVADVQIGDVWKTVLVAGLNGGGRGYYAIDVTDPTQPAALWELCADAVVCADNNDPDLGLTFGNPQFGMWNGKWVVFLTSGYNNIPNTDGVAGGTGKGYLFIVNVATGHVEAKISTDSGDTTTPSGLAKITAISANPLTDPITTYIYGGDNQGQMWRFDLTGTTPSVSKMGSAGVLQPITTRPEVTICQVDTTVDGVLTSSAKTVVAFGTGRLLDTDDVANIDRQSLYVIRDSATTISSTQWRAATAMAKKTLTKVSDVAGYTIAGPTVDLATMSGWYVDFDKNDGERVNLDPKVVAGGINVVTNMPSATTECAVGGTSNVYQLNVCTGGNITPTTPAGMVLSNASAAVGFIIIRLPSGALKMVTTTADGNTITSGVTPAFSLGTRKVGWRRVRN
jgi:type IV pilus assembly protein PilY1